MKAEECENGIEFVENKNGNTYCASCSPYCNSDEYNNTEQATVSTCESHVFVKKKNVNQCLKSASDCDPSTMVLSSKYDENGNTECLTDNEDGFYLKMSDGSNPPYKFSCSEGKYPYVVKNH